MSDVLIEAIRKGYSNAQMADACGVTKSTVGVWKWRKRSPRNHYEALAEMLRTQEPAGPERVGRKVKERCDEGTRLLRSARESGYTLKQIANVCGVSRAAVSKWISTGVPQEYTHLLRSITELAPANTKKLGGGVPAARFSGSEEVFAVLSGISKAQSKAGHACDVSRATISKWRQQGIPARHVPAILDMLRSIHAEMGERIREIEKDMEADQ